MKGYCAIVADILHVGHINFIKKCWLMCSDLTVGVMSDECVKKYKGEYPVMPEEDRMEIILSLKYVKDVILQDTFELPDHSYYNIIFDSIEHKRDGADCYLPITEGISSTIIKERIKGKMEIRPSYAVFLGLQKDGKFTAAEIGVREGFNASEMLKASDNLEKLILVDNYIGDEEQYEKVMLEALKPYWGRCDYRHMTSAEAAAIIPDNSLDYCYIDAAHEYGSVIMDLQLWYPKVRKLGMLAGHDLCHKPLREAVIYFSQSKQLRLFGCVNIFFAEQVRSYEGKFMDWWAFKHE